MGKTIEEIAKIALPDMDNSESVPILKECCKEENAALLEHGGILFPKLEETLKELSKNYHLYVVSNCQDGYVQAFIEYHKMDKYFEDIEMAGRTGMGKADNIKLIVQRNNLDEAVYVGDTDGDYNSTKAVGLPFVYAEYGFGNVEDAEYVIKAIDELPEIVEDIFNKTDR